MTECSKWGLKLLSGDVGEGWTFPRSRRVETQTSGLQTPDKPIRHMVDGSSVIGRV